MKAKLYTFIILISCLSLVFTIGCAPKKTIPGPDPAKLGTIEKDITYCTIDGVAINMDIYYPLSTHAAVPAVIWVHGGSWARGDKNTATYSGLTTELVNRGYLVAAVNYRLAPAYTALVQIEDIKCAIRYLRAKASDYGIDPENIGAIGESSGAHLVALLGTTDKSAGLEGNGGYEDQSSRVQAVVDFSGPVDLVTMFQQVPIGNTWLQQVFGTGDPNSDAMKKLSPVTYVSPDDPPFFIIHGDRDTTVPPSQSETLYQKLLDVNVPATLVMVKNADHTYLGNISPSLGELVIAAADFFDQYLKN
jgi:acetyl esterase/lipase